MVRPIGVLLAVAIAVAAVFVTWQTTRVIGGSATPASEAPSATEPSPRAVHAPITDGALGDAALRTLLDRLVASDAVDALNDDALVRLVNHDLAAALRVAERDLNPAEQPFVIRRVASFAVGIEAPAALEAADVIRSDALRRLYRRAVLDSWAAFDPGAVLTFLVEADPKSYVVDWRPLAHYDPYAVLLLAEQHGATRTEASWLHAAHLTALGVWAEQEPDAAIAYTQAITNEEYRQAPLQAVARAYARRDHYAAMRWANELGERSGLTAAVVVSEVARTNADTVVGLLLDDTVGFDITPALLVQMREELGPAEIRGLANALVARRGAERADRLFSSIVNLWVQGQPDAALDWLAANLSQFNDDPPFAAFADAARNDQSFAALALERLPPTIHAEWNAAVRPTPLDEAGVDALRGQAGYAAAFVELVTRRAQQDPREAWKIVERAAPTVQPNGAERLGSIWGRQNADEAATWAESIADPDVRAGAVSGVALSWSRTDEEDAVDWVFTMPGGAVRDTGVAALLVAAAERGVADERLLLSFTSDAVRQSGVSRAVPLLAKHDIDAARLLVIRFLRDPDLRASAETLLARVESEQRRASPDARGPRLEPVDVLQARPPRRPSEFRVEQDAIGRQERPAERVAARRRAHAELQSRGYSGKALEQVASTLRYTNDRRFFLEALERWARSDGYGAFLAALDSAEPLRSAALRTVGAAWVEHDPHGALAAAERLPDDLRYLYSQDLFAAWSLIDSKALVRYLESVEIDSITQRLIVDMRDVLREHPDSARAIASRLPNAWRGLLGSEFR